VSEQGGAVGAFCVDFHWLSAWWARCCRVT
jgi:hypothetical protein